MKIIILGTSNYSEYVYKTILVENQIDVLAFSSTRDMVKESSFLGIPLLPLEDLSDIFDMTECEILITVGYTNMNNTRIKLYECCKNLGYKIHTFISIRAMVDSKEIGEGCIIMPTVNIPPCAKIGKCNIINVGTFISHGGIIGDFNWFAGGIMMGGNIKMMDKCFIGINCALKNSIVVESETFLGADSYLNCSTKKGLAYIGRPATNRKGWRSSIVIDFVSSGAL